MEINKSIKKTQDIKKIKEINQKRLVLARVNLLMTALIFMLVIISCFQSLSNGPLGYIIIIQGIFLCFLQAVQIIRKRPPTQADKNNVMKQEDRKFKSSYLINIFNNYVIRNQHFDVFLQILVTSVYFTFFEVLLVNQTRIQHIIIISLFLSLFNHVHKIKEKQYICLFYTIIQQIYTILRLQISINYNIQDLMLNIIFLLYSLSYNNFFITKTQKHKMTYQNQKILTEQVTRLYQNILSIIPEGLAVINSDKKLLYANPTLKKILQSNQRHEIQQILMNLGKQNEQNKNGSNINDLQQKSTQIQSSKQHNINGIQSIYKKSSQEYRDFKGTYEKINLSPQVSQEIKFNSTQKNNKHPQSSFSIVESMNYPKIAHSKSAREITKDNKQNSEYNTINQDLNIQTNTQQNMKCSIQCGTNIIQQNNSKSILSIQNNLSPDKALPEQNSSNRDYFEDNIKYSTSNQNSKKMMSNQSIPIPQSRTQINIQSKVNSNCFQQSSNKIDISQKVIKSNIKDYSSNYISSNRQFASDQSEILSFQGFGFFQGEEDQIYSSMLNGLQASQQIKRSSECFSVKANVDQNSAMTLSQNSSLKYQTQVKNNISGQNIQQNIELRIKQKKQNAYPQTIEELKESKFQSSEEIDQRTKSPSNIKQSDFFSKEKINLLSSPLSVQQTSGLTQLNIKKAHSTDKASSFFEKNRSSQQISINKLLNSKQVSMTLQNPSNSHHPLSSNRALNKSKDQMHVSNQDIKKSFTLKVKTRGNLSSINKIDEHIQLKNTYVEDILDNIFKSTIQNIGEANDKIKEDINSIDNQEIFSNDSKDKIQNNLDKSTNGKQKRNSFFSTLKRGQQTQNMTYLQQKDNITKIQVKYKNKDLVVQFLLVDMLSKNQNKDPLVLIMVQDTWQELLMKKVQELQKDKMRIFASLSHELRTPLNCSISMLEVLRDEIIEQNPDYVSEYLNPALFSNKLLLNQINDILDFVQMDSGKFQYSFLEFSIIDLIKDCIKLVSMQAQMKKLDLYYECGPEVPEIICSDPNRIRQILLNFLSNSLKFTKQGQIQIGVNCVKNGLYNIYVKDSGIGITEQNLNNLFVFCGKIDYNKNDEGLNLQGCGLGLTISDSIAKGLVDNIYEERGVRVQSKYGEGSTFSILIQDRNEKPTMQNDIQDHSKNDKNNTNMLQLKKINSANENDDYQKIFSKNQIEGFLKQNSAPQSLFKNLSITKYANMNINQEMDSSNETCNITEQQKETKFQMNQYNYLSAINEYMDDIKFISSMTGPLSPVHASPRSPILTSPRSPILSKSIVPVDMQDSTMVIDEDTTNNNQIQFHPDFKIKHHLWLQEDQQNSEQKKIAFKQMQLPSIYSDVNPQIANDKGNRTDKFDNQNSQDIQCLSSLKQLECSQKTEGSQKNQFSGTSIGKKQKKNNSQKVFYNNMKSNLSLKSLKSNQLEVEKQPPEQEGFTSYITLNKKLDQLSQSFSMLNPHSAIFFDKLAIQKQKSTMLQQSNTQILNGQSTLQNSVQLEDKKFMYGQIETISQNLSNQDIVAEIINNNQNKNQSCTCPQILIVDDNQFNLYALCKTIKQFQFKCQQISDSMEVIDEIKQMYYQNCCQKPKLIFLDIEMPEKNGYQVAIEIHQFYQEVNVRELPIIIACTAYVGQEDREKALNSGMDDFINKPILKSAFNQLLLNWRHLFI